MGFLLGFLKEKMEAFAKGLAMKVAASSMFYPFAHVKVLMQLGYEPFPLTLGKKFGVGQDVYFLPNGISYAYKWTFLFTGLDAHICYTLVSGAAEFFYMDRYHPAYGGPPVNLARSEDELSDVESARRALRSTIRSTTARLVATVVARPFAVIMVRKVAQVVGGENKYTDVFSSVLLVGREEGPKGLFSGLVPQLISEFLTILGINGLIYVAESLLMLSRNENYDSSEEVLRSTRMMLHWTTPLIVNTVVYPFNVVSTVMAITGSGLAASLLPYSPLFGMWQDAWHYLDTKQALNRGARFFLRQHKGPITVHYDGNIYASNAHFV
ncbi:unnamed protein product [Enterobius vermicularis]|uniref:Mitochondrial carrier homolog 2 n=1 Tax=Enterobius vermicularis TaxID=51028 RepID=A0A0N4UZR0_ENTVE|nr:unnamed protein product [Enterobius vermicularis]